MSGNITHRNLYVSAADEHRTLLPEASSITAADHASAVIKGDAMGSSGATSAMTQLDVLGTTPAPLTADSKPQNELNTTGLLDSPRGNHGNNDPSRIPDAVTNRRLIENSIWDWDTPFNASGDHSPYLYEPQGELLIRDHHKPGDASDRRIPHPLSDTTSPWLVPISPPLADIDGFAVPRRPNIAFSSTAGVKRKSSGDQHRIGASKQPESKRISRNMSEMADDSALSPGQQRASSTSNAAAAAPPTSSIPAAATSRTAYANRVLGDTVAPDPRHYPHNIAFNTITEGSAAMVLPARKVFPIQIGDKLFRLSGASISSDAPSYFSQFFEEQLRNNEGAENIRTLYIDRDPATFEDISLHLQGYHVEPRDGPHFVKLFADAQFFSLPRLTAQLLSSTIYIRIGDEDFQIPKDAFNNPGDSPNFFSLGFAMFFTTPTNTFPGLSQRPLLRPSSILPPSVPNRSAKTFADLLHLLKGYPVEIRNEEHRAELLRDARYFHLKGLEQRIIPHSISYNLARQISEIVIRLEDIRQSGISFVADDPSQLASTISSSPEGDSTSDTLIAPGWVYYQRPYVDSTALSLIVEIAGEESAALRIARRSSVAGAARVGRAIFYRQTLSRITSLFSVIANKMNLPVTQPLGAMMMDRGAGIASLPVSPGNTGVSEERVKVRIGRDADITLNGQVWPVRGAHDNGGNSGSPHQRDDTDDNDDEGDGSHDGDDDDDDDDSPGMEIDRGESESGTSADAGRRRTRRPNRPSAAGDSSANNDDMQEWILQRAQWRLKVQPVRSGRSHSSSGRSGMEIVLTAVKIEAYTKERQRNAVRGFLV